MQVNEQFAKDVKEGLSSHPKRISSKYFYDEKGSRLFQEIMQLDEYYLTQAERKIFQLHSRELVNILENHFKNNFQIIELGAGDATKTEILIDELYKQKVNCTYCPTDIDQSVLQQVEERLENKYGHIKINKIHGYNKEVLSQLRKVKTPKLILFLGSNIGNYPAEQSDEMLQLIGRALHSGDLFLLGLDRKKDPRRIIRAYDDPKGVTKRFNLNLLHRINRELDANFPVDDFIFYPNYNVERGEVRSYLIAQRDMQVQLRAIDMEVRFSAWEFIHTEISRKFSRDDLDDFSDQSETTLKDLWSDPNDDFWLSLFSK